MNDDLGKRVLPTLAEMVAMGHELDKDDSIQESSTDISEETRTIVTLIHGTWAPRSAWTLKGSWLRCFLANKLPGPIAFQIFDWGGRNRHGDRVHFARLLAAKITENSTACPRARHYLICHSHGGNVALYALRQSGLAELVSGIVCLNTPFTAPLRRNVSQLFSTVSGMAVGYVLLTLTLLTAPLSLRLMTNGILNFFLLLVPVLVLGVLLKWIARATLDILGTALSAFKDWVIRRREDLILGLALPVNSKVPVLCIRNAGDEVGFAFDSLGGLVNFPFLFFHRAALVALVLLLGVLSATQDWPMPVVPFHSLGYSFIGQYFSFLGHLYSGLLAGIVYTLALVCIAALLIGLLAQLLNFLPRGVKLDHIVDAVVVKLTYSDVPLGTSDATFIDGEATEHWLSHSSAYNNENLLQKVVEWIEEKNRKATIRTL